MRRLVEALILPPMSSFVLAALGLLAWRRARRLAVGLWIAAVALLWLLATPWVGAGLLVVLQTSPALDLQALPPGPRAIVVLSADQDKVGPEFGGATVGPLALQRVRYGAALQRATGLPVLVSGGIAGAGQAPHAETMQRVLEAEFGVPVRWLEPRSTDTHENARYTAALLEREGVGHVLLVTHAWHMPRAVAAFRAFGLEVTPAPTAFRQLPDDVAWGLLPRWTALRDSARAMHELLGYVYYQLLRA